MCRASTELKNIPHTKWPSICVNRTRCETFDWKFFEFRRGSTWNGSRSLIEFNFLSKLHSRGSHDLSQIRKFETRLELQITTANFSWIGDFHVVPPLRFCRSTRTETINRTDGIVDKQTRSKIDTITTVDHLRQTLKWKSALAICGSEKPFASVGRPWKSKLKHLKFHPPR